MLNRCFESDGFFCLIELLNSDTSLCLVEAVRRNPDSYRDSIGVTKLV